MISSLETKLQQFVDELTPEEQARLSAMEDEADLGGLVPSARHKLERLAAGLTPQERAAMVGAGAAAGDGADTEGYMTPLYDDGLGNKGRPRPVEGNGGGGDFGGLIPQQCKDAWNLIRSLRAHNIIPTSITWPPY